MTRTLTRGQLINVLAPVASDKASRARATSQVNMACEAGVIGEAGIGRGKVAKFSEADALALMLWNFATELGWRPTYRNILIAAINSDLKQADYLAIGEGLRRFEGETKTAFKQRLLAIRENACAAMDAAEADEPAWVTLKIVEPAIHSFGASAHIAFENTPSPKLDGQAGGLSAIDLRSIVRATNARLDVMRGAWDLEDELRQDKKMPARVRNRLVAEVVANSMMNT